MGIDCSSTTIGVSVLAIDSNNVIKFIDVDYIKPIKDNDISIRLEDTRDKLLKLMEKYSPTHIGIEEIVPYMPGASSANTIITLAVFNRMACLLARDFLGSSPRLFNVMSIRHGLKLNKLLPKKEDIPDLVSQHLKINFPWRYNKKNNVMEESYDMADSVAVSLFYSLIIIGKCKEPITKAIKKAKAVARKKAKIKAEKKVKSNKK